MNKILWVDTETTGIDENKYGIFQLSGLIQIDGKIVETFDFRMNPESNEYDPEALNVCQVTQDQIESYEDEFLIFQRFMSLMDKYIDRYDRTDKFILAGYRVRFDLNHLYAMAIRNKEAYFMSYLHGAQLDVQVLCIEVLRRQRKNIPSFKLEAMCILFGLELPDAHDSFNDIVATFKLHKVLTKDYISVQNI